MQFLFWVPTVVSILLTAVLWHFYRENREYRQGNNKTHEALQSMNGWLGQKNAPQHNAAANVNKTEEKLRGYLTILDTLINNIPNPIYFKDDDGLYRGCNKSFAKRILGISRAEIIGRRSQDLTAQIPSELAACYQRNERKMRMKGGVHSFEVEVPCCGGIQIIHTPGHTPGHICLYHRESKTLIAGDLLFVENGKLAPAPSFINADTSMAMASIEKISAYDIGNVIAYHGGLFQDDPNQRLKEIALGKV